jgi:putative membrane protein
MKKPPLAFVIAFTFAFLFAFGCKKEQSANTDTATDTMSTDTASTASTSTSVAASDTSGTTSTNPSTAATPLSTEDQDFMQKAATGGMAEVSLGQQVSPVAKNPDAKKFADKMVTDHSKANDELKQLASTKGVTLPSDIDQESKDAAQKVLSAKNVDKAYMEDMVKDHDKDVKEFEKASKSAKDADLKSWIDKTLPVLKEHQKMAHDINSKLK